MNELPTYVWQEIQNTVCDNADEDGIISSDISCFSTIGLQRQIYTRIVFYEREPRYLTYAYVHAYSRESCVHNSYNNSAETELQNDITGDFLIAMKPQNRET